MQTPLSRVILPLFALALSGCGTRDATVSGNITVHGEALKRGQVHFTSGTGESASTTINADGTYNCTMVPKGEVTITVVSMAAENEAELGFKILPKAPKMFSLVSKRYNLPESSPLKLIVKPGPQKFNIELTDP